MLAFILLVVLGGGVGLLAVSLAESPKPATDRGQTRRAPDLQFDPAAARQEQEPDPTGVLFRAEDLEPADDSDDESELVLVRVRPTATDPASPPVSSPRRVPDPRDVPPAYTAVEGRFDEVAPPVWRRLLSLITIVAIAVATGVGVAAVAAAVIGALAELLSNTIG